MVRSCTCYDISAACVDDHRLERQLDYVDKLLFDRAARETAAAKLGAKNKENRTQNLQVAYKQSAKAECKGCNE